MKIFEKWKHKFSCFLNILQILSNSSYNAAPAGVTNIVTCVVCLDLWPSELDNWNDGEPQSVLIQLRDKNYPTGAALEGFILNSQGLLWIVDKPFWTRATTIRPRTLTSHLTTNRDRSQYFTSSLRSTSSFKTFLQLHCYQLERKINICVINLSLTII